MFDGKPITTITCTRPKSHTIRSPMVISHIHQSDTIRITWSYTETYSDGATPLPTPQNYEDNYSSTQTISEEAYKRLTELLDADEEDEYTRSDKEQPHPPQEGDIWAVNQNGQSVTYTIETRDVENETYTEWLKSWEEVLAPGQRYEHGCTLVWRDGKRWDGA